MRIILKGGVCVHYDMTTERLDWKKFGFYLPGRVLIYLSGPPQVEPMYGKHWDFEIYQIFKCTNSSTGNLWLTLSHKNSSLLKSSSLFDFWQQGAMLPGANTEHYP